MALEGALKMKEISYIHAEGYAAGELKTWPLCTSFNGNTCCCTLLPGRHLFCHAIQYQRDQARGAPVLAIECFRDRELTDIVDEFVQVPAGNIFHQILAATVILQLLAYHTADLLGCDIDKPRNLAKSVTVE